jgi:hypothetical protein
LVGTEKELRRERDDARASLAEAKRLLKPFAAFSDHKSSYVELPVRWCEPIARFLSQEPNHER